MAVFAVSPSGANADAAPGKITTGTTTITGQQGKILVIMATPPGGGPMARACWTIDSNLFSPVSSAMTDMPGSGGPCDGVTAETVFPPGSYDLTAGVYVPGSQTPEKSVTALIPVDGDAWVNLDGAALAPEATGDTNCDSSVDAVDALFVLKRVAEIEPFAQCISSGDVNCGDGITAVDALFILRSVAALPVSQPPGCSPLLAAPVQISPPDGSVFSNYPRDTALQWDPVPGAAGYVIQVDYFDGCPPYGQWCTDVGWVGDGLFTGIHDTSDLIGFVGRGQGRWRVWAVDETGRPGPKSPWWGFRYTV